MVMLGLVIGFIVGAVALGWSGGLAGGFIGFIVALALRSRNKTRAPASPAAAPEPSTFAATPASPSAAPAPPLAPPGVQAAPLTVAERLTAIEQRLAVLEQQAGVVPVALPRSAPLPATGTALPVTDDAVVRARAALQAEIASMRAQQVAPAGDVAAAAPAGFVRSVDGTLQPVISASGADADATASAATGSATASGAQDVAAGALPSGAAAAPASPLWAWMTGGNLLTRVGVIVLFFGVGFLLKYFAEFVTIPIAVKLAGVACVGGALMFVGVRFRATRPGYGLSLEGAGAGILYLTTFAAFRLYEVLPATVAFALLVAIAAFTVWRATRTDSQPLAALAIAGGFLAPFLVSRSPGAPAMLFGYFAILNAAIFALAWVRAWRALNVLGFVFTFALGIFWGDRFYQPQHFATVEPFLILFFAFYVTIAILYAKKSPLQHRAPVDALLVFGVPLVGFALQAGLVHDMRYGAAWSAVAIAAVYGLLSGALFRREEPGLRLLARAFLVLAIIFATIAIPFATDPRWTSAWWALEAAAVYWIGCRQQQGVARGFALLLQLGAAIYFGIDGFESGERLFLNATFLGTTLIALAAFGTAYVADRYREVITVHERQLVPLVMTWGLGWWYGGGWLELSQHLPRREEANAMLAFTVASVVVALLLRRALHWPRLVWLGAPLLPMMALIAFDDWDWMRTTLPAYGWAVWPLAWITHWWVLHAADDGTAGLAEGTRAATRTADFHEHAHTASAIGLVAWLAWEASEWVGRAFPSGTVWLACAAALPAVAYLGVMARPGADRVWPIRVHRDAYLISAATAIAALLAVWFAIVNVVSPGDTEPLPFVPVLNPLDLTLVGALAALFAWARNRARIAEKTLYGWSAVAGFLLINAIVFRTAHQWLDVPWRMDALLDSKPLQAALTLVWTATALPLMVIANKRAIRPLWMVGAALLAAVVAKLFLLDLGGLSGLPRVVAFLGVGVLLLLIGYLAPLPPASGNTSAGEPHSP
jgi:uncharacterized membrane protein